jgi:hypothetical protein
VTTPATTTYAPTTTAGPPRTTTTTTTYVFLQKCGRKQKPGEKLEAKTNIYSQYDNNHHADDDNYHWITVRQDHYLLRAAVVYTIVRDSEKRGKVEHTFEFDPPRCSRVASLATTLPAAHMWEDCVVPIGKRAVHRTHCVRMTAAAVWACTIGQI